MVVDVPRKNAIDQKSEHQAWPPSQSDVGNLHWDDLKYLLAVADTGSFRGAAEALGISINAVRNRISDLEHELNCILFARSNAGVELTTDGRSVYTVALEIREQVRLLDAIAVRKSSTGEGLVRVAITEGLGTFWIMPKLSDFVRQFPKIRIDLRCEMKVPDLSRLECDVAVQLETPRDESLVVRKIGTLHLLFFATADYIATYGVPHKLEDLGSHSFVHLVADQIPSHLLGELVRTDPHFRFVRILTNTSSAQVMALAEGAGVGVLPSYSAALSHSLVPLETEFYLKRPIWLVYHPQAIELPRVRAMCDWLIEAFNPEHNPWFRDEFVHPHRFAEAIAKTRLFRRALKWKSPEA
jgi:DNA-binding transcriptional LysR family regulator